MADCLGGGRLSHDAALAPRRLYHRQSCGVYGSRYSGVAPGGTSVPRVEGRVGAERHGRGRSRAKMRQAERAVDRSCHVGDRCPTRLVISATSGIQVQLPGLTDGVECRAFRRFGCGACPETPHGWEGRRVPKHPAGFVTACKLTCSTDTPSPLSQRQSVTSRAVVLIDLASLFLRNQEFSGRLQTWRPFCRGY
jgi:hypothetical protein